MDMILTTTIVGTTSTATGWFIANILSAHADRHRHMRTRQSQFAQEKRERQLHFVQQQLNELYGPLALLVLEGQQTFETLIETSGRGARYEHDAQAMPQHELEAWFVRIEADFFPCHEQIRELLLHNLHLVAGDRIPESFLLFLSHRQAWKQHYEWYLKQQRTCTWHERLNWPGQLNRDVLTTLHQLKREQIRLSEPVQPSEYKKSLPEPALLASQLMRDWETPWQTAPRAAENSSALSAREALLAPSLEHRLSPPQRMPHTPEGIWPSARQESQENRADHRANWSGVSPQPDWLATQLLTADQPGHHARESHRHEHVVQFYQFDETLIEAVSTYLKTGLDRGEACLVMATPEHRRMLEEDLQADSIDLALAQARGDYLALDAWKLIPKLLHHGLPDAERFTSIIGEQIAHMTCGRRRVRVFGELVTLLWGAGNQQAAIELEKLWNELQQTRNAFSLFCAYAMHDLGDEVCNASLTLICQQHSRLVAA